MPGEKITLEAARVNAGYTQAEAAELLDVSVATIRNYESGKSVPTWDMVLKIERVYKWPASFIIFGKKLALSDNDAEPPTMDTMSDISKGA